MKITHSSRAQSRAGFGEDEFFVAMIGLILVVVIFAWTVHPPKPPRPPKPGTNAPAVVVPAVEPEPEPGPQQPEEYTDEQRRKYDSPDG